jgi:hypothetical protein
VDYQSKNLERIEALKQKKLLEQKLLEEEKEKQDA